jgi:hypothetical protein
MHGGVGVKVFVFGYDRYDSMTTSNMLERAGVQHRVLIHTEEARERFIAGGQVVPERLVVTGQPKGLANNRNAALDMMEPGEWAVFLVDDLKGVTEVADYDQRREGCNTRLGISIENQKRFAPIMDRPVSLAQFIMRAGELTEVCDRFGAHLGGFCGIANPIFRDKKWRFNVLADGRAWVVRKGALRFDPGAQMIDDLCWTAQNIQAYGVVVVNQWVLPDCKRYTAGAFGSIEQRTPQKIAEAAHLVRTYPGLITYKDKAGWAPKSHVVLRRTLRNEQIRLLEKVAAAPA